MQVACVLKGDRCYIGYAPTLSEAKAAYGSTTAELWLMIQLRDLSEFAGCRDKLTEIQLEGVAQTILLHFGFLKITELMVFFQRYKAGDYGHFYGSVDGLVITEALQSFLKYRSDKLYRISEEHKKAAEKERLAERGRMMNAGELLTREEWREISWLYNLGYERR